MDLAAEDADALRAAEEAIKLVEYADASAGESGEGGSGDAELGERSPAENEAGVEDEIDDVGDPEQTHGDGGVACAAEDGVIEKEQHDDAAAAEGDACVAGADSDDLRGGAHEAKQVRRVEDARNADERGDCEANGDGLYACDGSAGGILFADSASDHGGCGKAKPEADGHDEAEERFGEADGGDGVRAETADPENVDDGKERLQHHFQNHGNGEKQNRAIEIASSEVLMRAAQGFAYGAPQLGRRRPDYCLFERHLNLYVLRGRYPENRARGRGCGN